MSALWLLYILEQPSLGAPCEYVCNGLVPGFDWAPFWPLPLSRLLVAMSTQYLAVYLNGSGFTPNAFLLSGWLLTNVQVNNITTLHNICAHIYIHHISITNCLFFLRIFHPSWQAGWPSPFLSDTHIYMYNLINIQKKKYTSYHASVSSQLKTWCLLKNS